MRKWLSIVFVGIFIVSGFGTVASNVHDTGTVSTGIIKEVVQIDVSSVQIIESESDYLTVRLSEQESYLMNPGQPMVPRVLKHYELPFGVTNVEVTVEPVGIQEQTLSKEIRPAPAPAPYTPQTNTVSRSQKDTRVYMSDDLYPEAWYGFHVGCGINAKSEHITHLTVNFFPVRYRPTTGELQVAQKFTMVIQYQQPAGDVFPAKSTYDLVIISPSKFSSEVQRLVDHKISMGVSTVVKTNEDIYAELGEIIVGKKSGRVSEDEITVFDSTGLSIEDISTASKVFEKAKNLKVGYWTTL